MKEKDKKDEWYLPWVVRSDPLRPSPMRPRLGSSSLGGGFSSPNIYNKLMNGPSQFSSSNSFNGQKYPSSDVLTSISSVRSSPPIRRLVAQSLCIHEGLLRSHSGNLITGDSVGCKHRCGQIPKRTSSPLRGVKFHLHNRARSFDGHENDEKHTSADQEKGSPVTPRKESSLRQAESLDNVFDQCDNADEDCNGLAVNGSHPSVSNAKSLPHINRLSDYEDELDSSSINLSSTGVHLSSSYHSNRSLPHPDVGLTPKISESKRVNKKKRTNLRRRHATREKDGRSKSLTQIDSLVDSPNSDMLLLGSHGGGGDDGHPEDGGRGDKLGIPDDHSTRRAPLSMENRVASGEFITVLVDCGKDQYEDFLLATRGLQLREALESRGLEVNGIDVYQEGTKTLIPLHIDTSQLGGKCIHVKARDDSKSPVRYRSAQIPRKPSGGRFIWSGTSTEEYSPLVDERTNGGPGSQEGSLKASKSNKPNNRWSLFQSNSKDSKMDELAKQLNLYSRSGIPKLPHLLACQSMGEDNELKLEEGWRCIVSSASTLTEREEKQQSAVWELIETEATYISMLKVITDLFLACLCNLQNERILNEIDTGKLFNNIQDIYQANLTFWRCYVTPLLEETRRTRLPLDPTLLLEGFAKFEEIFEPYTQYCLEQTNCQLYCKYHARENNYFKAYLAWCETQKECNRLKLVDILVQPMQRLTRYSILLKAVHKKTEIIDHKSYLQDMITHVDEFVSTVNNALRNRHEHERLKEIIKKIESYDAVEARDDELSAAVRAHSELNLLMPMPGCPQHIPRWLLYEGDFRFRDAQTSKTDVHVFVFTDFLLITKITQRKADKVKIVRPPYKIDRLIVVELKDSSSLGLILLTDWGVASAAFTLQSSDVKAHKSFLDGLASARKLLLDAKQSRERPVYEVEEDVSPHVPRSPRLGSSRASRVSSLAHSHSGSMDLNEGSAYASPGGQHPPSVDLSEIRASSASSEDSGSGHQAEIQRSKSLEGQHSVNSPNRQERRMAFPKSPNTLSVTPPYTTGQSLPNLTSDPSKSLKVPTGKQLSSSNRGVSYPPPSPRTLRRCPPVPQSRNPPLIKTRHVTSVASQVQEVSHSDADTFRVTETDIEEGKRRLSRVERLDNRRYHTAGAIDDIKKQDTKDTTIHKRLSLNYGQTPPPPPPRGDLSSCEDSGSSLLGKQRGSSKSISCESVHSSSGVSSTSSLLRAEYEALENIDDDNELQESDTMIVDLPISDCTSLKLSPHISTTYICHDSDITMGVSASQYITQPMEDQLVLEVLPEGLDQPGVKIDVSGIDSLGVSSVQITVNESLTKVPSSVPTTSLLRSSSSFSSSASTTSTSSGSSSMSNSSSSNQAKSPKDDQMRELLLTDASVEASDV